MKKISIITVCYNSSKTIEDTIKSVLQQSYSNFEHIIVDGLSPDRTLEIVDSYRDDYKGRLVIVSEKDSGIYDAMNKGIALASGDIIGILNSDDIYAHDCVLEQIENNLENDGIDGVFSDIVFYDERFEKIKRVWKTKVGNYRFGWHPPHPTLYLKKEIYEHYGVYKIDYKIAADYEFMIRVLKAKISLKYVNDTFVKMRLGGASTNGLSSYIESIKEADRGLKENQVEFKSFIHLFRVIHVAFQILFNR